MVRAREPFIRSMDRVAGVLALHKALHGAPGRPRQHVSDILRGSLVLSVGALDGLVLDAMAETIEPALRKGDAGPTVVKWVKEQPERLLGAFAQPVPVDELVALCREQLSTMTFQRAQVIQGVMGTVAKCDPPWDIAALSLSTPKDKWTGTRVANRLDEFVVRRHAIAHSGDMAAGRSSSSPIQLGYVVEAERVIRAVGMAVCERADARIKVLRRV